MQKSILRKGLVVGIILLFVGTSMIPGIIGDRVNETVDYEQDFTYMVNEDIVLNEETVFSSFNDDPSWEWARRAGGNGEDFGWGVAVDASGNAIITGSFRESASFGSFTLTSAGNADVFVAKLNSNGVWQWAKSAGGSSYDTSYGVAVDSSGNVYITGKFASSASFGPFTLTSTGSGGSDVFVAKLNTNGVWQWAVSAGSSSSYSEEGFGVAVDSSGNVYITGGFSESASFGPFTLISAGGRDVFVAKLNTNGVWQWAKSAGGSSINGDTGWGVAVDTNGNVYITGHFYGTATFGSTTLTSAGNWDVFVAKLNTNGVWQWAKSAGGSSYDNSYGVAVDTNGNVYITGYFYGTATFGSTTLTSAGIADVFVAKLNSNGVWQWAKSGGGSTSYRDNSEGVAVDTNGNVYITGYFYGTATFGSTTLTSAGNAEVFVAKLNSNGVWQWAKSAGGSSYDYGYGVAVDSSGNVYITGEFQGSASFGPFTLISAGGRDVFVAKLSDGGGNQPPYPPSNPSPANNAVGVSITTSLSWTGGDPNPGDTVTYDIYFGTNSNPPLKKSNHPTTTYNPGTLNYNTKYYWKIVAKDNHGETTTGPIWSFTTVSGNQPPVADAGGPYYGEVNVPVTFDASGSYSPSGTIVGYRWDWNNNGVWDTNWLTTPKTTHTYQSTFSGKVKLEIKDNNGLTNQSTADITIYNMNLNLEAYWNFDDGQASDVTGNGWHGNIYGDLKSRPGVRGNSFYFSGNDYIEIKDFSTLKQGSFSLCFWVKPHTIKYPKTMCIFDNADFRVQLDPRYTDDNIDWMWLQSHTSYHNSYNQPAQAILSGHPVYDGGSNHGKVWLHGSGQTKPYMVPKWQFVVIVYDESAPANQRHKVYIDGVLSATGGKHPYENELEKNFYMGKHRFFFWFDNPDKFKGHLDEIRVYKRVLNQEEIKFLYAYPIGNGNPPVAVIDEISPFAVRVGQPVNFVSRGHSSDGSIELYQWDFNGDGYFEWSSPSTGSTTHNYVTPGAYYAGFRTIDTTGKASPVEYERVVVFKNTAKIWGPGTYELGIYGNASMGITGHASFGHSANKFSGAVGVQTNAISLGGIIGYWGESRAAMVTPEFTTTATQTYQIDTDFKSVGGVETFWGVGAAVGETGGQIAHFQYNENEQRWELKHGFTNRAIDPWWEIELINILLQLTWFIPGWPGAIVNLITIANTWYTASQPSELKRALESSDNTHVHGKWRITLSPGRHFFVFGPYSSVSCYGVSTAKAGRYGQVRFIATDTTNLPPNNDLIFTTLCPVSLNITDPMGRYVNLTNSTIPDARYLKIDLDFDGTIDNYVQIPNPLQGEYRVFVIPNINASGNDTFSITVNADGGYYNLVDTTSIENISPEGYLYNYLKPLIPQDIKGPSSQQIYKSVDFSTSTTHPENDKLYYMWDWGDGNFTEWLGPYDSGVTVQTSYTWYQPGVFDVKVKAKSMKGPESNWSEPHKIDITMPYAFLLGLIRNIQETDDFTYFTTDAVLLISARRPFIAFYRSDETMAIKNGYTSGRLLQNISILGESYNFIVGRFNTAVLSESPASAVHPLRDRFKHLVKLQS